jgi:hypothetical protein
MDFPEFFALIGFVMQNGKRGVYGEVVGTVFETPPDEPEAIEDVLAVVCEPAFLAQFTEELAINLAAALPAIAAYVDEMVPSASCLYEWMEGVLRQGHATVPLERFVEVIHDVGEQYYAEFDARARRFHAEQLYRWCGEAETQRCAAAFAAYTDKSSVLARPSLEPLLSGLGYPVTSHEGSKAVLAEFTHPKDKANVLFPELLHCLKTLSVVRFRAENGRGDYAADARGLVQLAAHDDADGAKNPLHGDGGDYAANDALLAAQGVAVERAASKATHEPASAAPKAKGAKEAEAPSGGYMLVAKNLLKKKLKKVKARDEVDEEGYVKPKAAYELFVLTNPTADQVELLNQWANLMTDVEKLAFEREAQDMRKAYDELKGGVTDKTAANEFLKRKKTGHAALSKGAKASQGAAAGRGDLDGAEQRLQVLEKALRDEAEAATGGDAFDDDRRMDELLLARQAAKAAQDAAKKAGEEVAALDAAAAAAAQEGGDLKFDFRGRPLAAASQPALTPVETQLGHVQALAAAAPPPPPPGAAPGAAAPPPPLKRPPREAPAKHRSASVVVPPGLSASGVPAELTAHLGAEDLGQRPKGVGSNAVAQAMPHLVGPVASLPPPPPPRAAGLPAAPSAKRQSLALPGAPMGGSSLGGPSPFGGGSMGALPPPPPPGAFRR